MAESKEEKAKRLTETQHREASLHWTRNGFFLLSSSIMLLALSQFEVASITISFGVIGIMLNIIWLLIQYRSSEYIKDWKNQVKELERDKNSIDTYSGKVGGYEMRKLAMLLPVPFLIIWSSFLIQGFYDYCQNVNCQF